MEVAVEAEDIAGFNWSSYTFDYWKSGSEQTEKKEKEAQI